MENEAKDNAEKKPGCLGRIIWIIFVIAVIVFLCRGCFSGSEAPSGLEDLYIDAQKIVCDQLLCPSTAVFPQFDRSFVTYADEVLEDHGMGMLDYRVYDVKAYVDSENAFGAMVRNDFWVKVYAYDDDYRNAKFREEGTHKGIKDHNYVEYIDVVE